MWIEHIVHPREVCEATPLKASAGICRSTFCAINFSRKNTIYKALKHSDKGEKLLKELLEIKKEIDPTIQETFIKLNIIAREIITRRRDYDIYGPMIDRVYIDNAAYVKVVSSERDATSERVPIKNGFFMLFVAPPRATAEYIRKSLKIGFEALDDKYIKDLIRLCNRFKELLMKTQATLARASDMNVEIDTNLGNYGSNIKFNIGIKFTRKLNITIGGVGLTREDFKSAGSFRDTKTYINLIVDKSTDSKMCEKLMDDVEHYFVGGH